MSNYYKWMFPSMRSKKADSKDCFRVKAALEQLDLEIVKVDFIVQYVNEFLSLLNMKEISSPIVKFKTDYSQEMREVYKDIKKEHQELKDINNIVWMKFTKDGYIGVVATSADINFSTATTSGKIIHYLGQQWDESFILIFPLINIPDNLTRQHIESGIGNYLISKQVPILDFYSHNL